MRQRRQLYRALDSPTGELLAHAFVTISVSIDALSLYACLFDSYDPYGAVHTFLVATRFDRNFVPTAIQYW